MHTAPTKLRSILFSTLMSVATLACTTMAMLSSQTPQAHAQVTQVPASNSKVIVFTDFQCPSCKKYAPELARLETGEAGNVEVEFKNYPLSQHKNAKLAAYAAEAARLQGRFGKMHDLLFAQQASWANMDNPRSAFLQMATQIGLDVDKFSADLDSASVKKKISDDIAAGDAAGLESTPTAIFAGTKYTGKQLNELGTIIRAALSASTKQ